MINETNFYICKYTDTGGRPNNEDSYEIIKLKNSILIAVADGLGGYDSGEIASRLAIDVIRKELTEPVTNENMLHVLEHANNEVVCKAKDNHMKTTLAALWLDMCGNYVTGNVGDSRIYQIRKGQIIFQSRDHSLAQYNILSGDDKYSDVRENPDRNKLIRTIGMENGFKVDIECDKYISGDAFLVCSDGFWEKIYEKEMLKALGNLKNAQEWMNNMKKIIVPRLNEESDNNTAITLIVP